MNKIPGAESACGTMAGNSVNPENVPAYGTFRYTRATQLSAFTGDNTKVTEVSQYSYSMYLLVRIGANKAALISH
jgi:hypothetical protein